MNEFLAAKMTAAILGTRGMDVNGVEWQAGFQIWKEGSGMDLNNLRLFVSVVQTGSLSATAEKLGMPIATLSRRLGDLESTLKTQLLDRSRRGATPTMHGQRLYEQVYLSIDSLTQAESLFSGHDRLSGTLRISTFSASYSPLLDTIHEFRKRHPEVHVHCQATDRLIDLIADGIDIAVRFGNLHTDDIIARRWGEVGTKIVAHPDLLARLGMPDSPDALTGYPCAVWAQHEQREYHWLFSDRLVRIDPVFTSNDSHALAHVARTGMALSMLSDNFADELISRDGLVEVLAEHPKPVYPVHLIHLARRHPSSLVKAFLEACGSWGRG